MEEIFEKLKSDYQECIYKPDPSEELYEFDFHLQDYEKIKALNDWFKQRVMENKKAKLKDQKSVGQSEMLTEKIQEKGEQFL